MKFIDFGVISYTIIYPLLFPLSFVVRGIVRTQYDDYQFNYIMNSLFMFIAELLLGLINICYQCFNKDKKEDQDTNFDSSVLTGDSFLFLNKENEQKEEELSTVKMIGICNILGLIDFLSFSLPMLKTIGAILYLQLSNETIFYILVVIGCLVYNGVLIIYGCGMEVDTVREVTKRAEQDYELFIKKIDNSKPSIQLLIPSDHKDNNIL